MAAFREEDAAGLSPQIAVERNENVFKTLDQAAAAHPDSAELPSLEDVYQVAQDVAEHPIARWRSPEEAGIFFRAKCNQRALCHYLEWTTNKNVAPDYVYNIWMRGSLAHDEPDHEPFRYHVAGLVLARNKYSAPEWMVLDSRMEPGVLSPRAWNQFAGDNGWDLTGDRRIYITPGRQFTPAKGAFRSIMKENDEVRKGLESENEPIRFTTELKLQREEAGWSGVFDYYRQPR